MTKYPIKDRRGVLDVLFGHLNISESVIRHCEAHGEPRPENIVTRAGQIREAIRFILEHSKDVD